MKKILLLISLFTSIAFSQEKVQISGKILDGEMNNEPLFGATVIISGTTTGAQADFDGKYVLEVAPGTYTLEYNYVGYLSVKETINITENTTIDKVLTANSLEQVVITTSVNRENTNALLLDQKKATSIKQAIGAQEMSNKGVSDAAGAVSKISGVSKQEGSSNVYVRGLGDRYLNTTLNGLTIPSNKIENKNIDLNLFSSDVIKNVAISKAYDASLYADFAAGNIDINSKEQTGKGFIDASINTGFNTNAIGKNFVKSDGTGSVGFYTRYEHNPYAIVLSHGVDPVEGGLPVNRGINVVGGNSYSFNDDSNLSFFVTGSFDTDYKYRKGKTANYASVYNVDFPEVEEYETNTATNLMANITYKADKNNKFKFNSLFVNSSSNQVGYYGIGGNGFNKDANANGSFYQMNVQFNQDLVFINQLIGEHKITNKTKVEWGVGYNIVDAHEPDRKRISLQNYNLALDNDPNTNPIFFTNNQFDNQRYFQDVYDAELTSRIKLEYEHSDNLKLNFGFNGRSKERDFENSRYGYDIIDTSYEITDVSNINSILNISNQGIIFNTVALNGLDPDAGITETTNFPAGVENQYNGEMDVYAGYVTAEIKAGEKFSVIPGVRVENFKQNIDYDVQNVSITDPGYVSSEETLYLPSLNFKYALTDKQNIRFAFSNTVSLPEFKEGAPFVYVGVTDRIGGNPDLFGANGFASYSKVFNYDLKYEWFFGRGEIISIGGFVKEILDPVNLVTATDATGTDRFFRTGDKAQVLGLEIEARKTILKDVDNESKLGVGFNLTLMDTKQDLKNSEGSYTLQFNYKKEDQLQGASPVLLNADVSYSPTFGSYKPLANLVFSYFSDRIYSIGSGNIQNKIEKGVATLDFVLKNKITEKLELNLSARNLLDPSIKIIRENTENDGDVILSEYKKGLNLGLQLKYNF